MVQTPCKEFADRIVDYVDGELPDAEAQAVARHLMECERCRQTAEALRRSLGLAQVLWNDNLAVRSDAARRCRSMGVPPMGSTAVPAVSPTGIMPVVAAGLHGRDAHATHGRDARATLCPYGHTTNLSQRRSFYALAAAAAILIATAGSFFVFFLQPARQPSLTFEEVQRQVARAGRAAELLAATRLVAQCQGTESIVQQQYRYILREYAGTPAAASLKADQNLKLGGTQND